MTLVAAMAACMACWIWLGPAPTARLRGRKVPARGRPRRLLDGQLVPALTVVVVSVAGAAIGGAPGASVAFAVALPALTAGLLWRRHRARAAAARTEKEAVDACQLVAGLLRVGHVPSAALVLAAGEAPMLAEAAAILRIGGPVGPVLRRLGEGAGRSGLAELGVAWEVSERTGASLTATLDALAERLAARRAVQDVVAAELSAPRATGRLLAVLPVAGVLLGYGFGGDPVGYLTGSLPGQVSLVVGVVLGCAGVFWTERIADAGVA